MRLRQSEFGKGRGGGVERRDGSKERKGEQRDSHSRSVALQAVSSALAASMV